MPPKIDTKDGYLCFLGELCPGLSVIRVCFNPLPHRHLLVFLKKQDKDAVI